MKHSRIINLAFLIFGVLCILYYLGMGLAVRFGQSLLWMWPAVGAVCIARYILVKRSLDTGRPVPIPEKLLRVIRVAVIVCVSVFLIAELFICSAAFTESVDGLDAIIVLGARVNGTVPSGALSQRILAAGDYLLRNPDTLCIVSGGRGDGENMTEARCMKEHLEFMGISPDRIITEERSFDTVTNFLYSLPLLPEGTERVGIVTNDFHLFRSLAVARKMSGLEFHPISAPSTPYGFLHYAMREFFAVGEGILKRQVKFVY